MSLILLQKLNADADDSGDADDPDDADYADDGGII